MERPARMTDWAGVWGEALKLKAMSILKRVKAPTPKLFKKIRNWGLSIAGVAAVLLTSPVELPEAVVKVAGYLAVAGGVASAVSQVTTGDKEKQ